MRTRYRTAALAALLPLVLFGAGCNLVRAKAAYKDANGLYKEENYRRAIEAYERAVALEPDFAEAHFYLASSHQFLYRPARQDDPENRTHLDTAIQHYEKSLEVNRANTPELRQLRLNTLGALTAIYSDPPLENYEKALSLAEEIVRDNPNDTQNLYAMANLYEKFRRYDEAEAIYARVSEQSPSDARACSTLAAFYNKKLWDDQGNVWVEGSKSPRSPKFEKSIATLERCAQIDPSDAKGHYMVGYYYWDKSRDALLPDPQKDAYADKGISFVNKALELKPDYWEAIVSKGLLYRVKAQITRNPNERKKYLDEAQLLQKQATDLRKEQEAPSSGAAS